MRYTIILLAAAATGCAGTPENEARTAERCSAEECFRQRDIRRVEVLDDRNVIVYTGARECPFRVEVSGFACRLDFALDVNFVQREPGSQFSSERGRYSAPQRVCSHTPRVEVYTGVFDQARQQAVGGGIRDEAPGEACRVVNVDSLTDDEVIELFVDRRLAPPPPPMGGGRLETPEQDDDDGGAAESTETGEARAPADETAPGEPGPDADTAGGQGAEAPPPAR